MKEPLVYSVLFDTTRYASNNQTPVINNDEYIYIYFYYPCTGTSDFIPHGRNQFQHIAATFLQFCAAENRLWEMEQKQITLQLLGRAE